MTGLGDTARSAAAPNQTPWQLKLFSKTLKKQQKLALLLKQIGDAREQDCLLVTNGDNNGALNHHFRANGGRWVWIENESQHIPEMEQLLSDEVLRAEPPALPVKDSSFDIVISIDVHEHLEDCAEFNRELARITRPRGTVVVTTPNGDRWKPLTVLKKIIGMNKEVYGHKVIGYGIREHEAMLRAVGLKPIDSGSYSHFFTEAIELAINLVYVKLLSKKSKAKVEHGTIAPSSKDQLEAVDKQYRAYSLLYPLCYAVARLDFFLSFLNGYAVSVVARKPE